MQLAVAAARDAAKVEARVAADLHRVAHARAAGADAVRETRPEDHDLMPEGILHRGDRRPLVHPDAERRQLAVIGQVQQALLLRRVHAADHRVGLAAFLRGARRGVKPLAVLADVEVETLRSDPRGACPRVDERGVLRLQVDARGVGFEDQRETRRAAHLLVLALGEALVGDRVDPVVGMRRRQGLADEVQLGGVHEPHLCGRGPGRQQRDGQKKETFHCCEFKVFGFQKRAKSGNFALAAQAVSGYLAAS